MINIPQCIYTKEILSFVNDLITYNDISRADDVDECDLEKFTAMCIRAFGCDCDVTLDSNSLSMLVNSLLHPSNENDEKLLNVLKGSASQLYVHYLDELIAQERIGREHDANYSAGKLALVDLINGERKWV